MRHAVAIAGSDRLSGLVSWSAPGQHTLRVPIPAARMRAKPWIGAMLALLFAVLLPPPASAQEEDDEEVDGLRERLTEREDKRRPPQPYHLHVGGRPLVLGGEYEAGLAGARRYVLGRRAREPDRVLLEQQIELETFYSGAELSLFAQVDLVMEEDLLAHGRRVSDQYVELARSG
jgi:hypothetical protein